MADAFDAVIFDCDGVLVDSEPITNRVLMQMLGELGLAFTLQQTMRAFVGKAVRDEIATIEALLGRPLPNDWYAGFARRRDEALAAEVRAVDGAIDAVDAIAAAGMPFAVASGADRGKMRITLGACGLLPRFGSRLFGADQVARSKPAPDVYLLAASALGADPARCAVIEDTPTGTRAGTAAGATVFGLCAQGDPQPLLAAGAVAAFGDLRQIVACILARAADPKPPTAALAWR